MTTDDFYLVIGELYVAQRVVRNDLANVTGQFTSLQEMHTLLQGRLQEAEDQIETQAADIQLLEQKLAKKKGGK